jgi:arginine:ornithine antiporter/lysine permease
MVNRKELSLFSLIAIVVGTMVGGGAYNLPSDLAVAANSGPVLLGWLITGAGMIALALVLQNVAMRRPDLDGGIYSFARAGFGEFLGFNSAWGYWVSALLGNVAYATLLFSSLSYFFPMFGKGNNLPSIVFASVLLWMLHFLILRGVREAAFVNLITTIGKLVPIFLFLILMVFAFHWDVFVRDFWGTAQGFNWSVVKQQVKDTMLVTLWVFVGVEGAVVMSGRAKHRKDVGRATVIGLLGTMVIYVLISVLSMGALSREALAKLHEPSLAYVLEHVVGPWGAVIINLGLVISLLGAMLGWTLLAAELPYVAARDGIFPRWLGQENRNGSPSGSLWLTNGLIQLFIIIVLFSESTYQVAYSLASVAILLPYLFSAMYQIKLVWTGEGYAEGESRGKDLLLGIAAVLYAVWLVYAAGLDFLLMTAILYALGIFFYISARRENGKKAFRGWELLFATGIIIAAGVAVYLIAVGQLSPAG